MRFYIQCREKLIMNSEEIQKTMEFMLQQQAKHESEIQDLRSVGKVWVDGIT
jgi:hypothetical protein